MINAIFKNDLITHVKLGDTLIIRKAKLEVLNGHIMVICDEDCNIYEAKDIGLISKIGNMMPNLEINYSKIKLSLIKSDVI